MNAQKFFEAVAIIGLSLGVLAFAFIMLYAVFDKTQNELHSYYVETCDDLDKASTTPKLIFNYNGTVFCELQNETIEITVTEVRN